MEEGKSFDVIANNEIEMYTGNAILALADSRNNIIIANTINGNNPNQSGAAIKFQANGYTVQENIISFNSIYKNTYGIQFDTAGGGSETNNVIIGNVFREVQSSPITGLINSKPRFNVGYITSNSGTATIPSGQTSVTVAHNLVTTPSKVLVTPRVNIGSVWVSARNSTHFTISCSSTPTADTIVDWYAEV
jgi:hypothetical protein